LSHPKGRPEGERRSAQHEGGPVTSAPAPLLAVDQRVVRMGLQQILSGVSLAVPERGVVTVLGANGVGKTTLMRAISGIYRVASGSIRFAGAEIANRPSHRIVAAGLAQAPEGRQVFSNMTVRENLILGAGALHGAGLDGRLDEVLGRFPLLRERYRQAAGSLSGGEQQMLTIGRALMSAPRLLLLDEPSLGLAPKIVHQIFALVAEIRSTGTAILLVEQNVKAALKVADHGYVMEGGRVALEGTAEALRADERIRAAYLGRD
jgi:branched-chain amino acid transport system ATP-binding protein